MTLAVFKNNKGIGILEVVAAMGISVVVLTSLVSLALFSLRSSLHSELQLEGTKLANRELELVRAFRDSSTEWENGTDGFLDEVKGCSSIASACHMEFDSGLSVVNGKKIEGVDAEAITRYFIATRQDGTSALQPGDQEVRISVVVSWVIGDDTKYARLYTDLTNWANK